MMHKWKMFVVLFEIIGFVCANTESESNKIIQDLKIKYEVDTLFTSIKQRSSPLYLCDTELGGIEYQAPASINCQTEPEDNENKSIVSITTYWSDVSQHSISAYECSGIRKTVTSTHSWYLYLLPVNYTVTKSEVDISAKDCWSMVTKKKTMQGDNFKEIANDVWETASRKTVKYSRWSGVVADKEVTNYRIQKLNIGIFEQDGRIMTTALTAQPCHFNESVCSTKHGLLVWKASDVRICRLVEGESSNCLMRTGKDGKTLTCPDMKISMHGFELVDMCSVKFGFSQGIFFLPNKIGEIDEGLSSPEKVRYMLSSSRSRREVSDIKKVHPFEAEVKANLNFLHDTLKQGTAEAVWRLENKICQINKSQLQIINAITQTGNPSLTAQFIYDHPGLRVESVGDLISIYRCIEVHDYRFLKREICTSQWPVEYILQGSIFKGYVEPHTHTIVQNATNQSVSMPENCRRFFFQTDEYIVRLTNDKAIRVHVDNLPQHNVGHTIDKLFPQITFSASGYLKATSDDDVDKMYQVVREGQFRLSSFGHFKSKNHITVKESESLANNFVAWIHDISSSISQFVSSLFWGILCFVVGIVFIILLFSSGLCCKIIKLPFSALLFVARRFRTRKPRSRSSKRMNYSDVENNEREFSRKKYDY